ncbi:hypothetical protein KKA14_18750 [bacterium]|nr:hypothetical protein [bacterium]
MKTLTIRNIPDDLYKAVACIAQQNNRSIQQQLMVMLDKMRVLDNESPIKRATKIRERLLNRSLGHTVEEIREERNR